jgi:hypothetical protein
MKRESRRDHNPVETRSEEAAKLASMLAPLEEQQGEKDEAASRRTAQRPNGGAIVVDTGELKLPKDFIEGESAESSFGLEPVVIFILMLALAFIAFIAYLISVEPSK